MNAPARKLEAHIWEREEHEHYVETHWVSERLFAVERFPGRVWDPCCGFGRIPDAAKKAGYEVLATDIVDRGYDDRSFFRLDFLTSYAAADSIVCNPPFNIFQRFAVHALTRATGKVAMIWILPRLNAARWLQETPLERIYLLTPRPSMPPGHTITAGKKPGGGTQDFVWLVWNKEHRGPPTMHWLHRDE